jgi:uncharacterized protein YbjT (DUF2867 family)
MDKQPTLVLGATGTTGRRVAQRLQDAGHPARAASRAGPARFDWSDPASWEPAVTGAAGMYLMAPDGVPVEPSFVQLAVDRGIRRIVLLSSQSIEAMGDARLLAAERAVRDAGVDWTILRAGWFHQNFDEGFFRPAVLAGELALPLGEVRQVFVDAEDIAAVAVAALVGDGHAGRTYALTGPRALSFAHAVELIGQAAGRSVRFRGADGDYLAQQLALGAPEEQARQEITAFAALRGLGDARPTDDVRRVTGREPKDFATFAAEAAARGAWRG